ncbi:MAG: helix-turn-helix domain-containing protein [Myxococcales bacterium]
MVATRDDIDDLLRRMTPVSAPREQQKAVLELFRELRRIHPRRTGRAACMLVGPDQETVAIPESVFHVLERVAEVLSRGDAVTVVPVGKELTTQQAADLLNVSRQYLVRLVEDGRIPHSKTGKHRRLRVEDVVAFKEARDRQRKEQLDALTAMSEEAGGYDELK